MPRVGDEAFGHGEGILGAADGDPVSGEPFVVVGVVVDLVGKDAGFEHPAVVDPGGGLLVPGGVLVAFEIRVGVPGHVPHVGDVWGGVAELGCRSEGTGSLVFVPEVDPEVVGRMHGGHGMDLIEEGVDCFVAVDG